LRLRCYCGLRHHQDCDYTDHASHAVLRDGVDTRNNKRDGKVHLEPVQAVAAGVPFGRPYNAPFARGEGDLTPDSRLYEDEGAGTRDEIR
jgi:hypothetical protein